LISVENEGVGIDRLHAMPLYHQIYLQLREEIVSGARPTGSRMPTEQELARNFKVSRITARRALDELAQTHLVERKRRVGTHVVYQSPAKPLEGDIEKALEALLTFGRRTRVTLLEMGEVSASISAAEALGMEPGAPVIRVVRVRWLDNEPLGHFISHVPVDLGSGMTREELETTPMLSLLERAGVQVGAAAQTITATLADAALAAALKVEIGSAILRVTRTVSDVSGRPVQHIVAQFRPDRYQIRLDLHSARVEPQLL